MDNKVYRILDLTIRLLNGEVINTQAAAKNYGVNIRTIQRDLEALRRYFSGCTTYKYGIIEFDRVQSGYCMKK